MTLKFTIDFFTKFLNENTDLVVQEKWADEMVKFKKSFKKMENKSSTSKESKGPKKNKSAYNIYCSENISVIKGELPEFDNKAIFSEMAKRWSKIKSSKEFDKYQKLADVDKNRYVKEKETFSSENIKNSGPKKARTAYMMFCEEERKNISDIKGKELLVELGSRWQIVKAAKDKRLDKYQQLADKDKKRFNDEKQNFLDNKDSPEIVEEVSVVVVEEESVIEEEDVDVEVPVVKEKKRKLISGKKITKK